MPNLLTALVRLMGGFRRTDLELFVAEHDRLYAEARRTGDYTQVAAHFYSVMTDVLEAYYGPAWHFVPPEHPGQSREEAVRSLHRRVARLIHHEPGRETLDLGCGIGSAMRGVALESGGRVTGVTIGSNEVEEGARLNRKAGLDKLCSIRVGDFGALPFEDGRFDSAYAIYSYKYSPSLKQAFGEVYRVLKPGGLFLIYDMVKSETFDPGNREHVRLLEQFAYATGMPPIHSNAERTTEAGLAGFEVLSELDLSQDLPWYDQFTRPPLFMTALGSKTTLRLTARAERAGLLPRGFAAFYEIFLAGITTSMVEAGKQGALTGSSLVVLRKPGPA